MEVLERLALLATVVWTGTAGDGLWFDAANWYAGTDSHGQPIEQVPGPGDTAEIGANLGTIDVDGIASVGSLTCGSGTTISITSDQVTTAYSLNVATELTLNGTLSLDYGGELIASGSETILGADKSHSGRMSSRTSITMFSTMSSKR